MATMYTDGINVTENLNNRQFPTSLYHDLNNMLTVKENSLYNLNICYVARYAITETKIYTP